jgi:phenylacetic acid degradation operon negative regulatory protein
MTQLRNARRESDLLERPLSTRSVIASLLLGAQPPRLPAALLVRWCSLFGIAEGTARVSLSRMVARGELRSRAGASYELVGSLRARQDEQDWSVHPKLTRWHGDWRTAVVTAGSRAPSARQELRTAMRRLRLAELREGVWLRPDNLPRESAPESAWVVVGEQCEWLTGRPDDGADELAQRLFAPVAWRDRAERLHRRLAQCADAIDDAVPLGDQHELPNAFVIGAAALAHIRADPLLPEDLLPKPWPGDELRAQYISYQSRFAAATAAWFRRARKF